MQIKIEKTLLFSIAVVFCLANDIVSAAEVSEVDVSAPRTERTNHKLVDTAVNKELHLNGSELDEYKAEDICSYYRPCLNGGTCNTWSGTCSCRVDFVGDRCEEIIACRSKCQNRLEVDCLYDSYEHIVYCSCKNSSLYYDEEADICKPCSCDNGYCTYEYSYPERRLVCRCRSGFEMSNGYCKECDCGYGSDGQCQFDFNGQKICNCLDGFFLREGRCLACKCTGYSDPPIRCQVTGNMKHCFCPEGYEEVDERCKLLEPNLCETNNTCHPSAKCYNRYSDIECECPEGYKGKFGKQVEPGEVCFDIDECQDVTNACMYSYSYRMNCINLPGSYRCECIPGFRPDRLDQDTKNVYCIPTSINIFPSVIVAFTALGLMIVSCSMHRHVKKKAAR